MADFYMIFARKYFSRFFLVGGGCKCLPAPRILRLSLKVVPLLDGIGLPAIELQPLRQRLQFILMPQFLCSPAVRPSAIRDQGGGKLGAGAYIVH